MRSRLTLQKILEDVLGSRNVYFQPPESIRLKYPCIIYHRDNGIAYHSNDNLYNYIKSYSATVVDTNPDSEIPDKLEKLRYCTMDRFYIADNLNHWVFTIYY